MRSLEIYYYFNTERVEIILVFYVGLYEPANLSSYTLILYFSATFHDYNNINDHRLNLRLDRCSSDQFVPDMQRTRSLQNNDAMDFLYLQCIQIKVDILTPFYKKTK